MSRVTVMVGSFVAFAVSFALSADISSAPAQLRVEQVIEKNVAARGGLQTWRALQSLSLSGKLEAGGNERQTPAPTGLKIGGVQMPKRPAEQAQLPFRMELKRGRKSRLEVDFHGQTAIQVYDGTNGWKLRPFLNRHEVEPYTAEEMKAAAMQSDL